MSSAKTTKTTTGEGDKFPVLSTRLAEVEPIVRPKVGRRPAGLERPPPAVIKPVAFGAKKTKENSETPQENLEASPPPARPKRRIFTPAFIAALVTVVIMMNLVLAWLMDGKNNPPAVMAETGAIILGNPSPPAPEKIIAEPVPNPAPAAGATVEVIPYRRTYDPELIEKLEQQNPPAAGRLY